MNRVRRPLAIAVVAGSIAALVTGCSAHSDKPHGPDTASARATASAGLAGATPLGESSVEGAAPSPTSDAAEDDNLIGGPLSELPILTQIAAADAPAGNREQIALRFLRALQAHDDLAADRELTGFDRGEFGVVGHLGALHEVMDDVRRNTQIDTAECCTAAHEIGNDSVLLHCGQTTVLVHVLHHGPDAGVVISDWDDWSDTYPGPHARAYTTVEF